MIRVLILILLLNFSVQAQSLFDLYKPLIPPSCIDTPDEKDNIESLFREVEQYNPSWIYNIIEYLKALDQNPQEARKVMAHFNYIKNEYFTRISEWISNEFDIALNNTVSIAQWLRVWSYLSMLKTNPSDQIKNVEIKFPTDENYRHYILFLYFSKNYESYNSTIEYNLLLDQKISEITASLADVYNNTSSYPDEKLKYYYEYAKEHPYLFKGILPDYVKQPVPVYLTEFLIITSAHSFVQKNSAAVGIAADNFNEQSEHKIIYSDDRFTMESELNGIGRNSSYFGGALLIGLKEYKTFFSSLNLTFLMGFTNGDLPDPEIVYMGYPYYIIYAPSGSTRVDPNFTVGSFSYSFQSYQFKAATPLIYFLSNLSLNAGVLFRYSIYKYKGTYTREDRFNPNWNNLSENILIRYSQDFEVTQSVLNIDPLVALNYSLFDFLDLRLSGTLQGVPQLELFVNYPF